MTKKNCYIVLITLVALSLGHYAKADVPPVLAINYKCTSDPEQTAWYRTYKDALLAVTPAEAVAAADHMCRQQFKGKATEVQITFTDGTQTPMPPTSPGVR
jgi:hypothetical protein